MTERDDEKLDLSAWKSPTPPRGISNRVMDAVRATAETPDVPPSTRATPSLRTDRKRALAMVLVGTAAAAAITWAVWPRSRLGAPASGHVVSGAPSKVALGDGTIALLAAGADIAWERHGARLDVTQTTGNVTYQHPGPGGLVVTTPLATIHTASASMNVEVPMSDKKVAIAGAAGAAVAAAVVVAVYEGRAEVRQPATTAQVVEAGGQVAVAAPPAKPAFQPVAKAVKDRAKRDEIAAAIASARAARASGVAGGGGGGSLPGGSALAPGGGTTAPVDLTPGQLSKEEIRDGVRETIPLLTECYTLLLDKYPHVGGKVIAKLVVEAEPDVGSIVTMQDDSNLDMHVALEEGQNPKDFSSDLKDFNQCLGATLESVALPPLGDKDGGRVEINYPFVFAPSEEEADQYNTDAPPTPAPAPPRPTQKKTPTSDAMPPARPGATPDDLLADSESAAKSSQWALALHRAEEAMAHPQVDGRNKARAAMIAVLAACNLKMADKAKRYYPIATPASKSLIAQRCLKSNIDLTGNGTPTPAPTGDKVMNPFQ